jgi:hypothetical protein
VPLTNCVVSVSESDRPMADGRPPKRNWEFLILANGVRHHAQAHGRAVAPAFVTARTSGVLLRAASGDSSCTSQ